jgi:lipoyltransferase/lipoate-protein ligase
MEHPPSIVIGHNQLILNEINPAFIRKNDLKVYRRPSGGGAIYADRGCFMYSFVTSEKNRELIYSNYLSKLLAILKGLGLEVYFSGRNDLMFQNKKFSGTAIYQAGNGSILHGTLLYDTNLSDLVEALNVDASKILTKGIKSVSERVINLKPFLPMTKEELMDHIMENICKEKYELTDEDIRKVNSIQHKFASDEWINGNNPRFTFQNKKRFPFGSLEVYLLIRNNKINDITFKGDFFEKKDLAALYQHFKDIDFNQDAIMRVLQENPIGEYIYDATNDNLLELLFKEERE